MTRHREAIKDAIDSVLQWREASEHTDDEDVLAFGWPEHDYDAIADAILAIPRLLGPPDAEQPPEGGCAETVAAYRWADPDTGT